MAKDDFEEDEALDLEDDDDDAEDEDEDEDLDLDLDDDLALDVIPVVDGDDDDDDDDDDEDESDDEPAAEDEAEESLDVLLAREVGDDDLVRLDDEPRDGLVSVTTPIGADEFTCQSCFLVKRRAQLADEKRMICLDCA